MNSEQKYLKYKAKYLELKNQVGGVNFDLHDVVSLKAHIDVKTIQFVPIYNSQDTGRDHIEIANTSKLLGGNWSIITVKKQLDGTFLYDLIEVIMDSYTILCNVRHDLLMRSSVVNRTPAAIRHPESAALIQKILRKHQI